MGFGLILIAAIPAYLAAGIALLLGSGWLMALGVLMGTGVASTLLLALVLILRPARRSAAPQQPASA